MELISIALATYNGEKFLREQLDSLLSQTYQHFEIIIHDDCSVDDTVKILEEYSQKDKRIHFKQNDKNLGFSKNFESIIAECNGKYIAFSDQDDIWEKKHLEVLYELINGKHLSCANSMLVDTNGRPLGMTMQDVTNISTAISESNLKYRLFYNNFVQGTAMMIETEFCKKCLPVPKEVNYHDYWFALVAAMDDGIRYSDEVILKYRQHNNNITSNIKNSSIREFYNCLSGHHRKHSSLQVSILKAVKERFPENQIVDDAIVFFSNHAQKKVNAELLNYYCKHQLEMFPTMKCSLMHKFIYLYI